MKQRKQKKTYSDDDGRVIAPMNIEGMPWYVNKPKEPSESSERREPISDKDARIYSAAAVKAGLLIVAVFGVAAFLFISLCLLLWK